MCPQQMGYVVSPGLSVFPVARLQGDAVSGPRGLSDPHLELHSLLADALSQTHLIRLHGEVLKSHTNSMTGSLLLTQSHCWKCFIWFRWGERQDTWLGIHQRFACSIFTRAHLDVTLALCKEYERYALVICASTSPSGDVVIQKKNTELNRVYRGKRGGR